MKRAIRSSWWLAVLIALLLCWTPGAFAGTIGLAVDSSVYNNQVLDGIYISPYPLDVTAQGTSNYSVGTKLTLFCDDFKDESYVGVPVGFNSTTIGGNLGGTLWGSTVGITGYQQAAWLSTQLNKNPGAYSYAIWALFDPQSVWNWLWSHNDATGSTSTCDLVFGTNCTSQTSGVDFSHEGGYLGAAEGQNLSGQFLNWVIYTPMGCTLSQSCASQEFFQPMPVPEGGSALLYLLLAGITCFGAMIYSRRQTARAGTA
jgi:hypothetical protein